MSNDMGGHHVMNALPPGPRARGRSPPAATIVNARPLGFFFYFFICSRIANALTACADDEQRARTCAWRGRCACAADTTPGRLTHAPYAPSASSSSPANRAWQSPSLFHVHFWNRNSAVSHGIPPHRPTPLQEATLPLPTCVARSSTLVLLPFSRPTNQES